MGVEADDIALVESTTSGLAIVISGLRLDVDEEVLVADNDHFATYSALHTLTALRGSPATVRRVTPYKDASSASAAEIVRAIVDRVVASTRIVILTWVCSADGVKTPVKPICDAIAAINQRRTDDEKIAVIVDGVHGFGIEDSRVADLGCDVFVAGCHKGILGPLGTGVVWMRRSFCARIVPLVPCSEAELVARWRRREPATFPSGKFFSPGGLHAYAYRFALGSAFEFHDQLGMTNITSRIRAHCRALKSELGAIPRVKLETPREHEVSAGFVCFSIDGLSPTDAAARLARRRITVASSPYRNAFVRVTPFIYNTEDELAMFVHALKLELQL